MDGLLDEINRKRSQLDSNEITSKKKYFKRGDLLRQERDEILKERHDKQKLEQEKDEKHSELENSNVCAKSSDVFSLLSTEEISSEDVIKRLRVKNTPIRLFGENEAEACQRLKLIEMIGSEDNAGLRNDFQAALEKMESTYTIGCDETGKYGKAEHKLFKTVPVDMNIEELRVATKRSNDGDDSQDQKIVLTFIRIMLNFWAEDLNKRSKEQTVTVELRMEGARFEQTNIYFKPLIRKLKTKTLSCDILNNILAITSYCLDGDFVKANDIYLQMAIGNAPWPIGVTMVGIHARTGRERIFSRHVAHVLNDETQRKYIQAYKRLMTLCQKLFPSDPSHCVEYGAF